MEPDMIPVTPTEEQMEIMTRELVREDTYNG